MDGGMSTDLGLLIEERKNVDVIPILNEKIKALQTAVDQLTRFKDLYEQSAKMIIDKERELAALKQEKAVVDMQMQELNADNFKLRKDLERMPELEHRDLELLRTELFDAMEFRLTVAQAKLIGGKSIFAKEYINLKFNGHTGTLVSNLTDTEVLKSNNGKI